ncbi:MAG: hypothetical protein O2782_12550 [bacterium]|nr:hypothetical protein [bacterium]
MIWQHTPYNAPLCISTGLSVALAVYIWNRRHSPGALQLFAVMVADG